MSQQSSFLRELKRRKVLHTLAIYIIAAWVILQVFDLAFPGLGVPDDAIRFIWAGAFLGFPIAFVFGWMYQVTSQGIIRTTRSEVVPGTNTPLKGSDYLLLVALIVVAIAISIGVFLEIRKVEVTQQLEADAWQIHANSIAILPLKNLTGDAEQDYFVDGMHETLTAVLAQIGALRVTSRTSTDVYRNIAKPLSEIARELGVANIMEGSVLRSGDQVQITLQLIDAKTDEHLWAKNYDRDLKDILNLQADVALAVAERIRIRLTPEEEIRLAKQRQVDPETYRAYLRGIYYLNQFTPQGFAKGLANLHEAVANDPGDPLAYAALARGYSLIGHSANPPPDAWARAKEAATKAALLDDKLPEVHTALAEIRLYYDWDWAAARQSFERAIELNPSQDWAHAHFGWYFQLAGDSQRAIEEMKKAQEIGPLMPLWSAWLAWMYWGENDLDKALAEAQKAVAIAPEFPWSLHVLGGVYAAKGMYDEALAIHERLRPIMPNVANWGFASTYILLGRRDDALRVALELAQNPGQKDLLYLALIYSNLDDKAEALDWLEAAHDAHVDWFPWIGARAGSDFTRPLEILSDEPRFQALIAELNLSGLGPD